MRTEMISAKARCQNSAARLARTAAGAACFLCLVSLSGALEAFVHCHKFCRELKRNPPGAASRNSYFDMRAIELTDGLPRRVVTDSRQNGLPKREPSRLVGNRAKSVWCITRQPGNEIGGTTFTNVRVMISFGLADALP